MAARKFNFEHRHTERVASVADLMAHIKVLKTRVNAQIWYRGQAKPYSPNPELVPGIGHHHTYNGRRIDRFNLREERNLLHRFRRRSYHHLGRVLNDWEALFLARHHGLPTRIMDWTASPLVGLWFACSAHTDHPGFIWAMARVPDEKDDLDVLNFSSSVSSPLDWPGAPTAAEPDATTDDAVKILHPFYNSPRIISQHGVFTLHSDPRRSLETYHGEEFREERLDIQVLVRWDVAPKDPKLAIVEELEDMGVNQRTVYPDLDGLAAGLWQSIVLRQGTKL